MLTDNILVKNEIRGRLISLRRGLDIKWIGDKSIEIEERLFNERDFLEKTYILFYSAFEKEVQTKGMIKRAVEMNKKVFLPVTDFKNRNILISELYNKEEEIRIVPENVVEIIIVPGIAFSEIGILLGYLVRKFFAEIRVKTAEAMAKKIILDAEKEAENKKKEAMLEAKEKWYKTKAEFRKEAHAERGEFRKKDGTY